jgi:hypothetical protein
MRMSIRPHGIALLLASLGANGGCVGKSDGATASQNLATASAARVVQDSVPPHLLKACDEMAELARRRGASRVAIGDTVILADQYGTPRYHTCLVRVTGFTASHGVDPDLYKHGLKGWSWHPFEANDSTYGLVRDSIQCEATILGADAAVQGQLAAGKTSGFRVACYRP